MKIELCSQRVCWYFHFDLLNLQHTYTTYMIKSLKLLPILAVAIFASSCRTTPTLDPMTMKPSERCTPQSAHPQIYATK